MKAKGTFLFIVFIAALIFGCNKTTAKVTPEVPVVTGKWYLKKSNDAYYVFTTLAHTDSIDNYTKSDYKQLNADGTGYISGSYSGLPTQTIKYTYAAKDSLVVLYQYMNTDSEKTDSVSLKTLQFNSMNWNITQTQTSVDFREIQIYNFYFGR